MTTKETGGPAFPIFPESSTSHAAAHQGLTMRDHFAGLAMQAYLTSPDVNDFSCIAWARAAYLMADAMLETRK